MLLIANQPVTLVALLPSDPFTDESNYDSTPWIKAALEELGLGVECFDRTSPTRMTARLIGFQPDVIWNTALNHFGEDGTLAGFIRTLFPSRPYVGSGVLGGAVTMDKEHFQDLARAVGYPGPDGLCFHAEMWPTYTGRFRASKPEGENYLSDQRPDYEALRTRLGQRMALKPLCSGASLGLHLVDDAAAFQTALDQIGCHYGGVLVEEYLEGMECSVCVLESFQHPLPICQIAHEGPHDTAHKLTPRYCVPARIDERLADELHKAALLLHSYTGCHGFSRLDCVIDCQGQIRPLEVNSNPGLIPGQAFSTVCETAGLSYLDLIRKILETAFLPRRREIPRRTSTAEVPAFPEELLPLLPAGVQPPGSRQNTAEPQGAISIAHYRC